MEWLDHFVDTRKNDIICFSYTPLFAVAFSITLCVYQCAVVIFAIV